jgi:uncharacterized membrane protein
MEHKMEDKLEIEIEHDIKEEKREIEMLERSIAHINDKLLEKVPSHFSRRDIVNAFFGSLIMGLTFILNGATLPTAANLHVAHIELIILITFAVLSAEIYYISYTRVKDKTTRKFGQFLTKRLVVLYSSSVLMSFMLVYLFNINNNQIVGSFYNVLKVVILVSFPCAIGAGIPSLLKQY